MKLEIKSIKVISVFKTTLYVMIPLMALLMIIGGIMVITGGAELKMIGMMYIVAMPILTVIFYGPMAMLVAFVYSILASKFGGLEIIVDDEQIRRLVMEGMNQQSRE